MKKAPRKGNAPLHVAELTNIYLHSHLMPAFHWWNMGNFTAAMETIRRWVSMKKGRKMRKHKYSQQRKASPVDKMKH